MGEYVLSPSSALRERFPDFVILKGDNTTFEIRFSKETGEVKTTKGKWTIARQNGVLYVDLDDFLHPVEGTNSSLRFGIDDDLGLYFKKVQ